MSPVSRFWHAVTRLTSWLTLSPIAEFGLQPFQNPLVVNQDIPDLHIHGSQQTSVLNDDSPVFRPPAANPKDHDFVCDYSGMKGWFPCSIPEDRECWLRNKDGREFNIHTDYEKLFPSGITRNFVLDITEGSYNADGQMFDSAKLFNESYPGPWIEACWGDVSPIYRNEELKLLIPSDPQYQSHK
jgi:hypothetical protein